MFFKNAYILYPTFYYEKLSIMILNMLFPAVSSQLLDFSEYFSDRFLVKTESIYNFVKISGFPSQFPSRN